MNIDISGLIIAIRAHGEHGAVVRLLTADRGMIAGYVRGGRSRRLRPVLLAGNVITAALRARTETQLPAMTAELLHGRAALMGEPMAAAAIEWTTALVATTLPESQPYPRIHAALDGVLTAIETAASARGWIGALILFERVMLAELGYGRDLPDDTGDPLAALQANGVRLADNLLTEWRAAILPARARLAERIARAVA